MSLPRIQLCQYFLDNAFFVADLAVDIYESENKTSGNAHAVVSQFTHSCKMILNNIRAFLARQV
jgi:hypothetical protein